MLHHIKRAKDHYVKYRALIHELVIRDLKVKYRRSFLGYLWSLLNPLLMMLVMNLVFSHVFRSGVENFPLYLICGQTLFTFFTESTSMAMNSIIWNASLLKKIYIPKFIFPVSRVMSSFVTMSFSLFAIVIVMIFTRAQFSWTILLFFIPILFLFLFCSGVGMMLSALAVYFRDITHLWGIVTLAWMYITPIFYSVEILPPEIINIIQFNPMYHYLVFFRSLVMYGTLPGPEVWMGCILSAVVAFVLGLVVFARLQRQFILHI